MDYFQIQEMKDSCRKIWEGYKMFSQTAAVAQSGYELTGVCGKQDGTGDLNAMFLGRGESGLEHQAKVAWLALAFIDATGVNLFGGYSLDVLSVWRIVNLALCHDVGEAEIGDIPDDGNDRHDAKDASEAEAFERFVQSYSSLDSQDDKLLSDFGHFQKKDSRIGRAIYALDKLDAVLTLINLERVGRIGNIMSKPDLTKQDLYFVEQTGTNNPVDCWAAHMRSQIEDFSEEIYVPVMTLLNVAICDVRGAVFSWWDKDIPPYEKK